ncbi:Transcription factor, MADS-box [Penicillium roqueforti FM164]|uniref:Transcription factor, MADS-box n=1 Tax=Penicillium roqueforti (strain FM164) TaxID=1365484 RepID=W6Q0U2_PENRF|nr:Transcription factor, MADS-box [Penicillium roqueforti FM164]
MAAIKATRSKHVTSKIKLIRQKQCRRKTSLMKKACEYSRMCSADVCVGIRMRETGQVHILSADASGFWAFLTSQLSSHYPTPTVMTDRDLEKTREETVFREQR